MSAIADLKNKQINPVWPLLALSIEVVSLGLLLFFLKYTVRYRSGLNDPDKLDRIWSRVGQIRYQPVKRPLLFALAVGLGSKGLFSELVSPILMLFGLSPEHQTAALVIVAIISITGILLSAAVEVLIYRVAGGQGWRKVLLVTFGANVLIMVPLIPTIAQAAREQAPEEIDMRILIPVICVILLFGAGFFVLLQMPVAIWASRREVPATAPLIASVGSAKLDKGILVVAVPVVSFYLLDVLIRVGIGMDTYLSRLAVSCSSWIHVAVAATSGIVGVNRGLFSNDFQWHWRAFLAPAVPLFVAELVLMVLASVIGHVPFGPLLTMLFADITINGSYGVLGTYAYLFLAEKYAKTNQFLTERRQPGFDMISVPDYQQTYNSRGW